MKSTRLSLASVQIPAFQMLLSGADGEEDGKTGDKGNDGGAAAGNGEKTDAEKKAEADAAKLTPEQKKIAALEEEKDRHWQLKKDAETARDDALKALKDLQDASKPEAERAAARLVELEAAQTEAAAAIRGLALENAFLKDNEFQWHNPARALASADLSKVEIGKDGTVTGLKAALQALAKAEPYLLKPKDGDDDGGAGKPPPASGGAAGSRKKPEEAVAQRQRLMEKYTALRGH